MKYISNIVLIIVSIFLSLFIVELSLKYFWKNPFRDTRPSEIVELRLLSPSINKVLNSEFLDKDFPLSNIVQTKIDLFCHLISIKIRNSLFYLGGSTTQCSYVQEKLRCPALVSTILNKNGLKVNTINSGRAGNTLHDSINIFFNYIYTDLNQTIQL